GDFRHIHAILAVVEPGGRVGGLKGPADEGSKARRLVLKLPQPFEMLNPFGQRLDMAEHHGGGRTTAKLMPDAVNVQPIVGHYLAAGDRTPHAVDENFPATSRQTSQPRLLEPLQHRPKG